MAAEINDYISTSIFIYFFISLGCISHITQSCNDKQFPNGMQLKMPAYLGAISVCVCFAAALVSLGLPLLIIPRQVMPWTGLLLMYEWSFMLFFLLFGSYLHLVYQWGRVVANHPGLFPAHPVSLDYEPGKGSFI